MPTGLTLLDLSDRLASHAERRQGLISENVANADTPGYRARDLTPFSESYEARAALGDDDGFRPAATRPGHAGFGASESGARVVEDARTGAASPNGNDVSLEDQMTRSAELRMEHDLALGVWSKSLAILRSSLGRGR